MHSECSASAARHCSQKTQAQAKESVTANLIAGSNPEVFDFKRLHNDFLTATTSHSVSGFQLTAKNAGGFPRQYDAGMDQHIPENV